ncbi:tryptophan-rich sensory protein [Paenibacillus hemerocallicola]|uniref:Tryptophan-rich sensory protein n=1 Tax=Paenibacillus hemerocallicola TaxID=1172614 RepID=A0A5C4TAW3_9BACL|nr:TspO/MBR family protein [Paenibacillus hemerocallicola]TNJ66198.1 tryptophan-rich sensory protein [Paenibacillus hemerocallicola]
MWWYSLIVFLVTYCLFALPGLLWPIDRTWYAGLNKPSWTPPAKWFGIAWSVLYALIAVAVALVFVGTDSFQDVSAPWLFAFVLNYVLNQAFNYFEFKQKKLFLGFLDSFAIAITACWLLIETVPYSLVAAWLLVPYLLWSSFATLLSWTIFIMNRDDGEAD